MPEGNRDFVIECDQFDVGRSWTIGRCWGDALHVFGNKSQTTYFRKISNNKDIDHLGFCGQHDGLTIRVNADEKSPSNSKQLTSRSHPGSHA